MKLQKYRKRHSDIEAIQWMCNKKESNIQNMIDWVHYYYPGARIRRVGCSLSIKIGDTCHLFLGNTDYLLRHTTGFFTVMVAWDFVHLYGWIKEETDCG